MFKKGLLYLVTGSFLGKLIGFLREIILASFYATTISADAYRAAITATLVPSNFLMNDTLNAGFLPLYKKQLEKSIYDANSFFISIASFLTLFTLIIGIALILFAKNWVTILVPGFSNQALSLTVKMTTIMAVGLPFYALAQLLAYLEMANGSYHLTTLRSSVQSIGLIGGVLLGYFFNEVLFLALGFLVAYIIYFFSALFRTYRKKYFWFTNDIKLSNIKYSISLMLKLIFPLLILAILVQLNIVVERNTASNFEVGTLSAFEYSKALVETANVLIAVPLGLLGLTLFNNYSESELKQRVTQIVSPLLVALIPMSTILFFNSQLIIEIIYKRGSFDRHSVIESAIFLKYLSVGLWALVIGNFLIKVLNSRLLNKSVMLIVGIAILLQLLFNILLSDVFGSKILGISISAYGITLFILTLNKLELIHKVKSILFKLILYCLILLGAIYFVSLDNKFIQLFFCILYWVIIIGIDPILRTLLLATLFNIKKKT